MIIEEAGVLDAEVILDIQKTAYQSEAELHNDFNIPPLTQTLKEIREDFDRQLFLKAVIRGEIVGSVRAYEEEGTCFIGRLIVRPEYQDRGIGTMLMGEIENRFSHAERFELFTGHRSEKDLYLYNKLGYEVFKEEPLHEDLTLLYMEKHSI
jgi:ribosomal protein S18 acetylase RimI-like enzyme